MKYISYIVITLFIIGCSNDEVEEQIQKFTIEITSSNGGSVSSSGGSFIKGSSFSVTATPNNGFSFVQWSNGSTSNPLELTVNSNQTIQAIFEETVTYELTIIDSEGGTVSVESGSYESGTQLSITATPNENYHFIGFEGIEGLNNIISITMNSNITIQPNFLIKDDGHKMRSQTNISENELNFLTTDNFIIWWDKDFNAISYVLKVKEILEDITNISLSNGMELPLYSDEKYVNLYFSNCSQDDIIQQYYNRCTGGIGTDENQMPYFVFQEDIFDFNPLEMNVSWRRWFYHELFHIMQYKGGNFYETFPYSLDNTWYVESTASWFGRKYGGMDLYGIEPSIQAWEGQPALNLQPQVSMWGGLEDKPYFSEISWSHGNHRYAMEQFFNYLDKNNIISESFIFESFYSGSSLLPQEYLYEEIENLEQVYCEFAANYTSGLMYNDLDFERLKETISWTIEYSCSFNNCNPETNEVYNNQYIAEIGDEGTIGLTPIEFISLGIPADYITPREKNEAWSWTVVKINTTQERTFDVDFRPDERGNEGTLSNFSLYLTNRENNLVQEVDFNGEITVNPNLDYFLVMVNTPQRFEGWETFDYQLKVTPSN